MTGGNSRSGRWRWSNGRSQPDHVMASGSPGRHFGARDRAIIKHRSTDGVRVGRARGDGGRPSRHGAARHGARCAAAETAGRLSSDGPDEQDVAPEVEVELRPTRKLRIWQLAPILVLAAVGSLMFAFPLAFEFGDGGAIVAMLVS